VRKEAEGRDRLNSTNTCVSESKRQIRMHSHTSEESGDRSQKEAHSALTIRKAKQKRIGGTSTSLLLKGIHSQLHQHTRQQSRKTKKKLVRKKKKIAASKAMTKRKRVRYD
jgi:hypothetical protein